MARLPTRCSRILAVGELDTPNNDAHVRDMTGTRTLALCAGAMISPIAGFVAAPFALLGAACALASLVLACVYIHEGRTRVL